VEFFNMFFYIKKFLSVNKNKLCTYLINKSRTYCVNKWKKILTITKNKIGQIKRQK
jgi:hypothetical protein